MFCKNKNNPNLWGILMTEDEIIKINVDMATLEHRVSTVEKLVSTQTEVLLKIEKRFTIIGSLIVGALIVSSDSGGSILRQLLGII